MEYEGSIGLVTGKMKIFYPKTAGNAAHWEKSAILASKFYNFCNLKDKSMNFEMKIPE
jgi:hypothetical protein